MALTLGLLAVPPSATIMLMVVAEFAKFAPEPGKKKRRKRRRRR